MEIVVGAVRSRGWAAGPIHEAHTLLEGGVTGAEEFGFAAAERGKRRAERGEAAFTDTDGADVGGFDEGDGPAAGLPGAPEGCATDRQR